MSYRFFYLYVTCGIIALLLLIYQVINYYPALNTYGLFFNAVPIVIFGYLAFKVRREKEDKDLM
jgi:hypothetical protein